MARGPELRVNKQVTMMGNLRKNSFMESLKEKVGAYDLIEKPARYISKLNK